ncbi:hypothetical protein PoB_000905600 [Plakobranchus ocellatus]|uniref:Uncharacterized protein n=1 Tax=Plakobranchus ocellatus TaxID=259542 RepID=A0AAV3Y5N0_9GAST|nr:hypothetical protein PoB_000905600 [Plakobranchus ocellatus]
MDIFVFKVPRQAKARTETRDRKVPPDVMANSLATAPSTLRRKDDTSTLIYTSLPDMYFDLPIQFARGRWAVVKDDPPCQTDLQKRWQTGAYASRPVQEAERYPRSRQQKQLQGRVKDNSISRYIVLVFVCFAMISIEIST